MKAYRLKPISIEMFLSIERPLVEINTDLLFSIRRNLKECLKEKMEIDPIDAALVRCAWLSEIEQIGLELALRN